VVNYYSHLQAVLRGSYPATARPSVALSIIDVPTGCNTVASMAGVTTLFGQVSRGIAAGRRVWNIWVHIVAVW
jgi:hypothetical protein